MLSLSQERSENKTSSPEDGKKPNPLLQRTPSARENLKVSSLGNIFGAENNKVISSVDEKEDFSYTGRTLTQDVEDINSAYKTLKIPASEEELQTPPKNSSKINPLESPRENYSPPEVSQTQSLLTNSPPEASQTLLQPSASPILARLSDAISNLQNMFNSASYQPLQNSGTGSTEKGKGQGKGR